MSIEAGTLYVVATPIGNLADLSQRALQTLAGVALIAAEDTRHTGVLLRNHGIRIPATALHEHNEHQAVPRLIERLRAGDSVALVSDAGTPLLSDPGAHLVAQAHAARLRVVPIPGPSAVVAALSVAGFPADRFVFEGFLPPRAGARRGRLQELTGEDRPIVLYEAPHRIRETLGDLVSIFGADRDGFLARELTKVFEELRRAPLGTLAQWLAERAERERGEYVVVVAGKPATEDREVGPEEERVLRVLLEEVPPSTAAALAARITGRGRRALYARALAMARESPSTGGA